MTENCGIPDANPVPRCFRIFGHSTLWSAAFAAGAFPLLTTGLCFLAMNLIAGRSHARTFFGHCWSVDTGSWLVCLGSLAAGGLSLRKGLGLRRHMLLVTDEGVSGRAVGGPGQRPKNFSLDWGELLDVKAGPASALKLAGPGRAWKVCLARPREAESLVRHMLKRHRDACEAADRH